MAISRTREYAADEMGARLSGHPRALASALAKISRAAEAIENETAERAPATAHLFIVNPLTGRGMDNLFSTHPSTENRIAALQRLAQEMGEGGFGREGFGQQGFGRRWEDWVESQPQGPREPVCPQGPPGRAG